MARESDPNSVYGRHHIQVANMCVRIEFVSNLFDYRFRAWSIVITETAPRHDFITVCLAPFFPLSRGY